MLYLALRCLKPLDHPSCVSWFDRGTAQSSCLAVASPRRLLPTLTLPIKLRYFPVSGIFMGMPAVSRRPISHKISVGGSTMRMLQVSLSIPEMKPTMTILATTHGCVSSTMERLCGRNTTAKRRHRTIMAAAIRVGMPAGHCFAYSKTNLPIIAMVYLPK